MGKKIRIALPFLAAFLFTGLIVMPISPVLAQGLGMIIPLENQINADGLEDATARVAVFTWGPGPRSATRLEIDAQNLHCRSGGTLPDCPDCDQLGAAFYSLYIDTVSEPPTRLHIFNTDCSTQSYRGDYELSKYLFVTEQEQDDILMFPVTFEIKFERDMDGDGYFENVAVVFRGESD